MYRCSKFVCNSKESLRQAGLNKVIVAIDHYYAELDPNLKDLLKPFQLEEHLNIIKKFDCHDVTVYCFGEEIRATGKTVNMINKSELKDLLEKSDVDLVVCIVEFVDEGKRITVKKESLDILRQCLFSRPVDTEILIDSYQGIHATEAKYIVFETLSEMEINVPKTVHHCAESSLEDIVLHRVMAAIQHVWKVAQSLRSSVPKLSDIEAMTEFAFQKHLNKEIVSKLANVVILIDDEKIIGNVSSGKMIYYNGLKVKQIRTQLIEKCSKSIVQQISSIVTEKIISHILNNLETDEIKNHLPVSLNGEGFQKYILKTVTTGFGLAFTVILTLIFGPIASIVLVPLVLYVLFNPVDVNDPKWRISCVPDIIDNFEKERENIISNTASSVQKQFELMSQELRSFTEEIHFPHTPVYNGNMCAPVESALTIIQQHN
ncbi:hypothetical protein KUTeg_005183 [Tegillarca granosa]|uniref:Uncharacterized protein n=1 Tax=Tegillarca granosa TaxID=220873 RepID=A0ABQ9FJ33_TEGGR|nr:hypothetical protein KUTeg_005183 [Tegillarca granosa]